jgi:hypothetical protein
VLVHVLPAGAGGHPPEPIRRQLSESIRQRLSAGFDVRPLVDVTVLDGS